MIVIIAMRDFSAANTYIVERSL